MGPRRVFGQNGINITGNNDQKVKLVKLVKQLRSFYTKMAQHCYSPNYTYILGTI